MLPEFASERNTVSNTERATKIGLFVVTTGLLLAGIIAVIIVVGSIFYMSDQSRQGAGIEQPTAQSLADDNSERNRL